MFKYSFLQKSKQRIEELQTNVIDFDNAIGGGLLKGKITELTGEPDCGKTKLLFDIIENLRHEDYVIAYIATSRNSLAYLRTRHLDTSSNLILLVSNLEQNIMKFIQESVGIVDLFIIDSISEVLTISEQGKMDMKTQQNIPSLMQRINTILYGEKSAMIVVNYLTYKNQEQVSKWRNIFQQYCSVRVLLQGENSYKLVSHKIKPNLVESCL